MRKWLIGLFAAASIGGGGYGYQMGFLSPGALSTPINYGLSLKFIGCTNDTTDATAYTFALHNVGTPNSRRSTIIGIASEDNLSTFGVNSVTVGGEAATELADAAGVNVVVSAALYIIDNPLGTTEDIVVTHSEAVASATVCVWAAYNLIDNTAEDTAATGAAGAVTLDVDTTANGITVGICNGSNQGATLTWVGLTERYAAASAETAYSAADFTEDHAASAPLSVSCTPTAGNTSGAVATLG
jgi:hypothetical protein